MFRSTSGIHFYPPFLQASSHPRWHDMLLGCGRATDLIFLGFFSLTSFSLSQFSSLHSLSHIQLFATPWIEACQASLSITNSWSSLKLMPIESVMASNHLILRCPLLLLPSVFPSIRVFSIESALYIRWPKYWSFSINPSSEYSGLISFRNDWFDLLAVQGILKSLL